MNEQRINSTFTALGIIGIMLGIIGVSSFMLSGNRQCDCAKTEAVKEAPVETAQPPYHDGAAPYYELMQMISDANRRIDATEEKIEAAMKRQRVTHRQWAEQYR